MSLRYFDDGELREPRLSRRYPSAEDNARLRAKDHRQVLRLLLVVDNTKSGKENPNDQ
jgi:hypothetical protein